LQRRHIRNRHPGSGIAHPASAPVVSSSLPWAIDHQLSALSQPTQPLPQAECRARPLVL